MPKVHGLTPKERLFVKEYLKDLNAAKAAYRAKYSPRSAAAIGSENLSKPHIAEAIEIEMAKRSAKTGITADRVLEELGAIAFAHMGEFATWDGDGVVLKPSGKVDPRAVSEVKQSATQFGTNVSIKLHDKLAALKLAGQHLGMFSDKDPAAGQPPAKAYPSDEWERLP